MNISKSFNLLVLTDSQIQDESLRRAWRAATSIILEFLACQPKEAQTSPSSEGYIALDYNSLFLQVVPDYCLSGVFNLSGRSWGVALAAIALATPEQPLVPLYAFYDWAVKFILLLDVPIGMTMSEKVTPEGQSNFRRGHLASLMVSLVWGLVLTANEMDSLYPEVSDARQSCAEWAGLLLKALKYTPRVSGGGVKVLEKDLETFISRSRCAESRYVESYDVRVTRKEEILVFLERLMVDQKGWGNQLGQDSMQNIVAGEFAGHLFGRLSPEVKARALLSTLQGEASPVV